MPRNKIDDLRNHLLATLEDLRDPEESYDIKRAIAIAKVAQVIVNSAKVEVDFLKATGSDRTPEFMGGIKQLDSSNNHDTN